MNNLETGSTPALERDKEHAELEGKTLEEQVKLAFENGQISKKEAEVLLKSFEEQKGKINEETKERLESILEDVAKTLLENGVSLDGEIDATTFDTFKKSPALQTLIKLFNAVNFNSERALEKIYDDYKKFQESNTPKISKDKGEAENQAISYEVKKDSLEAKMKSLVKEKGRLENDLKNTEKELQKLHNEEIKGSSEQRKKLNEQLEKREEVLNDKIKDIKSKLETVTSDILDVANKISEHMKQEPKANEKGIKKAPAEKEGTFVVSYKVGDNEPKTHDGSTFDGNSKANDNKATVSKDVVKGIDYTSEAVKKLAEIKQEFEKITKKDAEAARALSELKTKLEAVISNLSGNDKTKGRELLAEIDKKLNTTDAKKAEAEAKAKAEAEAKAKAEAEAKAKAETEAETKARAGESSVPKAETRREAPEKPKKTGIEITTDTLKANKKELEAIKTKLSGLPAKEYKHTAGLIEAVMQSSGNADVVKTLQAYLNNTFLKFNNKVELTVDGVLGKNTLNAMKYVYAPSFSNYPDKKVDKK